MAELEAFKINDTLYTVKDATARETADKVTTEAEYDRQKGIEQYKGRSLTAVFADEIGKHANIYAWLSARAKAGNFDGLRIGDYMDVPIRAGANVPAQTLRYHIAAIDPYYNCSDQPMPHHITFAPASPTLSGTTRPPTTATRPTKNPTLPASFTVGRLATFCQRFQRSCRPY